MKVQYVAWWWWSHERKLTSFGNGFGRCLASVSMSRQGSEENPKGSGSGRRRDRDTGSILVDYQTEELCHGSTGSPSALMRGSKRGVTVLERAGISS